MSSATNIQPRVLAGVHKNICVYWLLGEGLDLLSARSVPVGGAEAASKQLSKGLFRGENPPSTTSAGEVSLSVGHEEPSAPTPQEGLLFRKSPVGAGGLGRKPERWARGRSKLQDEQHDGPSSPRGRGPQGDEQLHLHTPGFLEVDEQAGNKGGKQAGGRKMRWYCPGPADYNGGNKIDPPSHYWGVGWVHAHQQTGLQSNFMLNLVGGRMDVDGIDYTQVSAGVNSNIYLTSPHNIHGDADCDSGGKRPPCYEMDLFEGAGSLGYCTTWHFKYEGGTPADTQVGRAHQGIFGLKYEVDAQGCSKIHQVSVNASGPTLPSSFTKQRNPIGGLGDACSVSAGVYALRGAMVHSSHWVGWTCAGIKGVPGQKDFKGSTAQSVFKIRGVRLYGSLVQGKEPRTCMEKANQMHQAEAKKNAKAARVKEAKLRKKVEASEAASAAAAARIKKKESVAEKVEGGCCGRGGVRRTQEKAGGDEK